MDRLIAFGCSNTFGDGLEHPSQGWPAILAKEFSFNLVNKAIPGSSVKRTAYTIQEFNFEPNDHVVILWPFYTRMWFNNASRYDNRDLDYDTDFYKKYFDKEDQLFSNYCYINAAVKKINTECNKQPWMIVHTPEATDAYTRYGLKIIKMLYLEYNHFFPTTACGHVGPQGQQAFASNLIHYIKTGKTIQVGSAE